MLLTKTQKKILEIVREYGGMRADMLNSLCPTHIRLRCRSISLK